MDLLFEQNFGDVFRKKKHKNTSRTKKIAAGIGETTGVVFSSHWLRVYCVVQSNAPAVGRRPLIETLSMNAITIGLHMRWRARQQVKCVSSLKQKVLHCDTVADFFNS